MLHRLCTVILFPTYNHSTLRFPFSLSRSSGLIQGAGTFSGTVGWSPTSEPKTPQSRGWTKDDKRFSRPIPGESRVALAEPSEEWISAPAGKEKRKCGGRRYVKFKFRLLQPNARLSDTHLGDVTSGSIPWSWQRSWPLCDPWSRPRRVWEAAEWEVDRAGKRGVSRVWIYVWWVCMCENLIHRVSVWFSAISVCRRWSTLCWNSCPRDVSQLSAHSRPPLPRVQHFISRTTALSLLISFYNVTSATVNLPYLFCCSSYCFTRSQTRTHTHTDTHTDSHMKLYGSGSSTAKVGNFIPCIAL